MAEPEVARANSGHRGTQDEDLSACSPEIHPSPTPEMNRDQPGGDAELEQGREIAQEFRRSNFLCRRRAPVL
jgi:hypothetical protein